MNSDLLTLDNLTTELKDLFAVDSCRLSHDMNMFYVILGTTRSTLSESNYYWTSHTGPDTERIDFTYLEEKVICSGSTLAEVKINALEYHRISQLSMAEYLNELLGESVYDCNCSWNRNT